MLVHIHAKDGNVECRIMFGKNSFIFSYGYVEYEISKSKYETRKKKD